MYSGPEIHELNPISKQYLHLTYFPLVKFSPSGWIIASYSLFGVFLYCFYYIVVFYKMHLPCPLWFMDFTMRLKLVRSGAHEPWNSTKTNRSTPTSEVNPPNRPIRCIQNMGTRILKFILKKSIKITRENPLYHQVHVEKMMHLLNQPVNTMSDKDHLICKYLGTS